MHGDMPVSDWRSITPEYVAALNKPTEGYLCPLSANVHKIDFVAFKIRDLDSRETLFEIIKDQGAPVEEVEDETGRCIRYHFGPEFLKISTIGTTLEFTIGAVPLKNFRMIERHYFKDRLLKNYDFTLPFCIPHTTNTWEVIYSLPELTPAEEQELIENPWLSKSDSFYFVDGQLVMHNKAEYSYAPL